MSSPRSGLKSAVLSGHTGFATVVAAADAGSIGDSATANTKLRMYGRLNRIRTILSPLLARGPGGAPRGSGPPAALPLCLCAIQVNARGVKRTHTLIGLSNPGPAPIPTWGGCCGGFRTPFVFNSPSAAVALPRGQFELAKL